MGTEGSGNSNRWLLSTLGVAAVVVGVPLVALVTCIHSERPTSRYATYEAARLAGAMDEGRWIPAFLPKSSRDIVETHDIDSNASSLTFQFAGSDLQVPDSCVAAQDQKPGTKSYTCRLTTELGGYWSVSNCMLLVRAQQASFNCGSNSLEPKTK